MKYSFLNTGFVLLTIQSISAFLPRNVRNTLVAKKSKSPLNMNIGDAFVGGDVLTGLNSFDITRSSILLSEEIGYSNLSLYFTLALYIITLPGLYSLVTRSVKVTEVQKTYDIPGPANPTAKPLKQTAAEIMAYFKALNYEPQVSAEVISFKGVMGRSTSQAWFLTFCTFVGLGSLGLVLSILLQDVGAKAYLITLLSPYAGFYYWTNAQREDTVKVKIETSDDNQTTSIIAQGGKEDLERFSKALLLAERGKVYVKGLFEDPAAALPVGGSIAIDAPVRKPEEAPVPSVGPDDGQMNA